MTAIGMDEEADLGRAALGYVERGWFVIPLHSPTARGCSCGQSKCQSPAKHPRIANWPKNASRDPATIREWWRRWPDANIGIVTGPGEWKTWSAMSTAGRVKNH